MDTSTKEQLSTISELLDSIDSKLPVKDQVAEEAAIEELMHDIKDAEAYELAYQALLKRAKNRHPAFQDLPATKSPELESSRALLEISPDKLSHATERLLQGKNTALIIRAGQYKDLRTDILEPLARYSGYKVKATDGFPKDSNGLGHSRVHLDVFYGSDGRPKPNHQLFKYGLTAAQLTQGEALFIAGLASPDVYNWAEAQYQEAHRKLNSSNLLLGYRERATDPTSPRGVSYNEWSQTSKGFGGTFIATTLHPGDVVAWPQGGVNSALPAWHGIYQIGSPQQPSFEPRRSTSYHFS